MYPLPEGSTLGRLRFLEVYDYFDGPRFFAARNSVGTTFLGFWCAEDEETESWLYVPVSSERLDELRDGAIPIRAAYLNSEDGTIYRVDMPKGDNRAKVAALSPGELALGLLPPEEDMVGGITPAEQTPVAVQVVPQAARRDDTVQHLVFASKRPHRAPPVGAMTEALGAWRELFLSTMTQLGAKKPELYPVAVSSGSFAIDLAIRDSAEVLTAFRAIAALVRAGADEERIKRCLREFKVSPAAYRAFLAAISEHGLTFDASMPNTGGRRSAALSIDSEDAGNALAIARRLRTNVLSSRDIPQADDLHRVFRVLELTRDNVKVTAEALDVVHRQVNYYKHAARVLHYLDDKNELTSAGYQLVGLSPEERLASTVVQFEASVCGFGWISWSRGRTLLNVDPESADEYLRAAVPDLSESTAYRRAQTLSRWHGTLKDHHYSS